MNKDYKPEVIRINLSEPFIMRAKCKHCGGSPIIYYYLRNPTMWFDPRKAMDRANYIRLLIKQLQAKGLFEQPKNYTSVSALSYDTENRYRPRMHRTRGSNPVFDVVEFVTCDCMKTTWAYSDKAVAGRPEITNRKSRYKYPLKFEF